MSGQLAGMTFFVTDVGLVRLKPETVAAMNAAFPGWGDPRSMRRRTKAEKQARQQAERGEKLFNQAVTAISALAWEAGQSLVEV